MKIEPNRDQWSSVLYEIARRPLGRCPDFPAIARRWEQWWNFEADRPLLSVAASKGPGAPAGKGLSLLEQPEAWLSMRKAQLDNRYHVAETVPEIRVDLGPLAVATFLGTPTTYSDAENTSWQTPTIRNWDGQAIGTIDRENRWWQAMMKLVEITAADAAGDYLVTLPDLGGSIDTLANMRGPENLLMDLYDHPREVLDAADRITDAWEEAFAEIYSRITAAGAGATSWLRIWSDQPYTVMTCDFNFSIGPEQFRQFCLPSLADQARRAGRAVIHVDGPGAIKHIESLAAEPAISAIQYTPGAATPNPLDKIDWFRLAQQARKPLIINCPSEHVGALVDKLDPRGLAIVSWAAGPGGADELAAICRGEPGA
jgi:hypothetical protein